MSRGGIVSQWGGGSVFTPPPWRGGSKYHWRSLVAYSKTNSIPLENNIDIHLYQVINHIRF